MMRPRMTKSGIPRPTATPMVVWVDVPIAEDCGSGVGREDEVTVLAGADVAGTEGADGELVLEVTAVDVVGALAFDGRRLLS